MEINKIYNVDAIKGLKRMNQLGIKVQMIFTDSPYGIDYQSNWGRNGKKLDKIKNDSDLSWFQEFSNECFSVLENNTASYFFTRFDVYPYMYNCLKTSGFSIKNLLTLQKGQKGGNGDLEAQYANDAELLIYVNKGRRKFNETNLCKSDGRKGSSEYRRRLSNVWFDTDYNKFPKSTVNVSNQNEEIIHPTEKNVNMIEWFVQISSNEGDIILDPFCGSGSTAVASKNLNRNYIGFDIEHKYINLANNRLNK